MRLIKNILLYYILVMLFIYLALRILLPDLIELPNIIELIIVLPLIIYIFVPRLLDGKDKTWKSINLGLIYFVIMAAILLIGNLNNFVVRFVFPKYGSNISITNYFWMAGMITFALGFLFFKNMILIKKRNKIITSYRKLSYKLVWFVFFLSLIGTLYSYFSLGFIPFIQGTGSGLRYTGSVAETSIPIRLWSLNVVTAILGSIYYLSIKRNKIILILTIFSFLSSLFFIIRINPFIIIVSV